MKRTKHYFCSPLSLVFRNCRLLCLPTFEGKCILWNCGHRVVERSFLAFVFGPSDLNLPSLTLYNTTYTQIYDPRVRRGDFPSKNTVFITKPTSHIELFLYPFTFHWTTSGHSLNILIPQTVLFLEKQKSLNVTQKGLPKLIWSPFKSRNATPITLVVRTTSVMMRQDRKRELSHTTCDVMSYTLTAIVRF